MRINARLSDESEEQIKYLREITGKNFTEIIKESLALYYETVRGDARRKNSRLAEELAGIGHGPADGSVNYKQYVADNIDDKFGNR